MTARRAGWLAGGALFVVYVATLAPSVTFWDSGEFIAAARVLGIPHPPGTPLFVILLNVWAKLCPFLPFATATNLFSAVCTAGAVGLTAAFIARATGRPWYALAAAITAGSMTSVWQNATETEVYAASLVLSVAAIAVADQAGRATDRRWTVLAAYLLALSLPLHLSALVAAPVVIYLVIRRQDGAWDWSAGLAMLGVSVLVAGVSRLSIAVSVAGAALLAASTFGFSRSRVRFAARDTLAVCAVTFVAASALLFLLVRARHDPAINQANPSSWRQLAYVVGRRQYDVQGLWPREAPIWLQIANWFEYADWQFALSLAPTVIPSIGRVLVTVGFAALGLIGSRWHRSVDRRTWVAVGLLLICGSLGVITYLDLKVGTSFAWTFVPDEARHEARDRDYFFVLGFWAWGIWAGMGAVALVRRFAAPAALGVVLAALPIVLNWSAVDRRSEPEASMAREVASMLLDPLPHRTVLFVAGDNDTYPLWYAQQVEHRRPDVTVVTMPLLGAPWSGDELMRRQRLFGGVISGDVVARSARIAQSALAQRRPVAVSMLVPARDRNRLGDRWTVIGISLLADTADDGGSFHRHAMAPSVRVDTAATAAAARLIEIWRRGREPHPALDPVHEYFSGILSCPRSILLPNPSAAQFASLDSLCNLR